MNEQKKKILNEKTSTNLKIIAQADDIYACTMYNVHIGGVVMAEVVEVTTQFFFTQPKRTCCNSKITPLNSQVHSSAFRNLHFNSVQKHL